ncbi:sensor histidine kinase [Thomasclavelia cocleata]|uniref:histidine kinase n=1 Tax=Thomasclavelia cocleata TaxID=69824 RepID=A0A1I0HQG4_9FIRM|nr:sensor histidine kinase [Thomasclavelia cocleata]MCR1961543.1 sensor histidine kinase [Thomasclavelia cocleata]NDO41160.1 HAMP domain-containing histidine kinase [Thomasclavelia cocleata]PJN81826.1 sensor histidine kinase [Thomasclavelia cocleata]SET85414.1 Histidine kinase-, DNA gyrase B-, and HSP90-like ATPase [Thomasclavelia cocleata]
MKLKDYLLDRITYLVLLILMMLMVLFFLLVFKVSNALIWSVILVMALFGVLLIGYDFYQKHSFYKSFLNKLEQLDKKCLITELISPPNFLEGKILYDALYEIDKSMYEEIEIYENNLKDFKEYIELWIHEVKLPISSAKLMIHNHEQNERKLKDQVNRIENYVEQVLYYARKDNSEKDYLIKSCDLGMIIRNVIKRNQDSLLYQKINIEIEQINYTVLSDTKWLEFIINQIVSNSIKYHCQDNCKIIFKVIKTNNIALEIIDNGIGIKKSDLSKVFNKSFTGENGRLVSSSTGMGLYIVKRLCDKLGHKIIVESQYNKYTKVTLYFNDDQYYNVVR